MLFQESNQRGFICALGINKCINLFGSNARETETLETDYTEMQLGRGECKYLQPRDRFVYYTMDGDNDGNWLQFCSVVLLCLENYY